MHRGNGLSTRPLDTNHLLVFKIIIHSIMGINIKVASTKNIRANWSFYLIVIVIEMVGVIIFLMVLPGT